MLKTALKRLKNFQELFSLLAFYLFWGFNPFKPDLLVTYSVERHHVQISTANEVNRNKELFPPKLDLVTFSIKNQSQSSIGNIELQVTGVKEVLASGAEASFKRFDPKQGVLGTLQKDQKFFLENIKEIPPGQNITVQLIANLHHSMLVPRIIVSSDAKEQRVYRLHPTSGIFAFMDTYSGVLGGLSIISLALLGLHRVVRSRQT